MVTTVKLANRAVEHEQLADDAVDSDKIRAGAIGGSELASGSVDSDELRSSAVTDTKLADNAVTSAKINDHTIQTQDFAAEAVDSTAIKDYDLLATDFADESVTTRVLKNGAVTKAKVASDAIDGSKVENGSLQAGDLGATGAVMVDPPPLSNGQCAAVVATGATGVQANDRLILNPPDTFEDGLIFSGTTLAPSAGTIKPRVCNFSGGNLDGNPMSWSYLAVR
jgi:hypothetical protein